MSRPRNFHYTIYEVPIILIMGLIPLLWFKSGYIITGIDINFPLDTTKSFVERIYLWNQIFMGGTDRSIEVGTLFFRAIWAMLGRIGFTLVNVEKISFCIWFTLPGISMYYFIRLFFKENNYYVERLVATLIYMLNFFVLYIWQDLRISDLSIISILPIMLGTFIKGLEKRMSYPKIILFILLSSIIGFGAGTNPAIFAAFLGSFLIYFIFHIISTNRWRQPFLFFRDFKFLCFFWGIYLLFASAWIIPLFNQTKSQYLGRLSEARIEGNADALLSYTSSWTSLLNLIRLWGHVQFFEWWGGEPYYQGLQAYPSNPILIGLSFFLPFLTYVAIFFTKHRYYRYVLFFTFLSILGTILGQGLHPPFGFTFKWLWNNIPLFWIFRAPWQKFGIYMVISYGFLTGLASGKIYRYLERYRYCMSKIFFIMVCILYIGYMYGLVLGKIFPTPEERSILPSLHVKYPPYILNASNFINSQKDDFKILLLPAHKSNEYSWGYGGPVDITWNAFDKGLFFKQYGEGMMAPHPIENLLQSSISSIYDKLSPETFKILRLLNVRYLLQRNDIRTDIFGNIDNPRFIKSRLQWQNNIFLEKSFGQWDFYKCNAVTIY